MKAATKTTLAALQALAAQDIDFCQVGSSALRKGVQHPDGVGPDVVTMPEKSFDHARGRVETKNTRYTKAAAPSKLYKPTHGGYPG